MIFHGVHDVLNPRLYGSNPETIMLLQSYACDFCTKRCHIWLIHHRTNLDKDYGLGIIPDGRQCNYHASVWRCDRKKYVWCIFWKRQLPRFQRRFYSTYNAWSYLVACSIRLLSIITSGNIFHVFFWLCVLVLNVLNSEWVISVRYLAEANLQAHLLYLMMYYIQDCIAKILKQSRSSWYPISDVSPFIIILLSVLSKHHGHNNKRQHNQQEYAAMPCEKNCSGTWHLPCPGWRWNSTGWRFWHARAS